MIETSAYQRVLDSAFALKARQVLDEAHTLLMDNQHLAMSPYQKVRTHYIVGEYYRALDLAGRTTAHLDGKQPLAEAADQYRLAAFIAGLLTDWALFAQLKSLESAVCSTTEVRQFPRSYQAASDALTAWRRLPFRDLTQDVHYEFTLADTLAGRASRVAEDAAAIDALERAAVLLQRLQGREDMDFVRYANDDLFLNWDWAAVYMAQGHYWLALRYVCKARRRIGDLTKPINIGRLHCVTASIALTCGEERSGESFVRKQLLTLAAAEIEAAYVATRACKDHTGRAMALLADARLMGLRGIKRGRIAKIRAAEHLASRLDDPNLLQLVEIGWGDEHAFRGEWEQAAERYLKAEANLTALAFAEQARIARQRLDRLPPRISTDASETTVTPPPGHDISPN